jgi:hypothetical protein
VFKKLIMALLAAVILASNVVHIEDVVTFAQAVA